MILAPVLARPGASARSRHSCTSWGRPRCRAKVAGQDQPSIGHQTAVVEGDVDAVGVVAWQHPLGAPGFGLILCFQTIVPDAQEHFLPLLHAATLISSVDWGLVTIIVNNGLEVTANSYPCPIPRQPIILLTKKVGSHVKGKSILGMSGVIGRYPGG